MKKDHQQQQDELLALRMENLKLKDEMDAIKVRRLQPLAVN